nr:DUF4251 domain-containing protein [uncultured Carboxylicivirga sp.]
MKKLFLLVLVIAATNLFAQQTEKELTRKEKRELKKQQDAELSAAMAKILTVSIDSQQWVLEADMLSNKTGRSIQVNSNLNFVAIDKNEAFIQLGSNSGLGANGVGGVSVRTNITKYEVTKNEKKGTFYIQIYASSALGNWNIQVNCNSDGKIASATIQGNTSARVNYSGQIVPIGSSRVYKGTPVI